MALKTEVVDRIPTYPGRVVLTPVSGATNTYDLTRADQPIEEGTPLNKALFDQKAYTLTTDVTVYVSTRGNDVSGDGSSAAPYATIQRALDSLPNWFDGHTATIDVAAGTYEERVNVDSFQGGMLVLGNSSSPAVTIRGLSITNSSTVRINIPNIVRSSTIGGVPLKIENGSVVQLNCDLTVDGNGNNLSGISVETNSLLSVTFLWNVTSSNNKSAAIAVYTGGRVVLFDLFGSGNSVGLSAETLGMISYTTNNIGATTAYKTGSGGRILNGAQVNVPNY